MHRMRRLMYLGSWLKISKPTIFTSGIKNYEYEFTQVMRYWYEATVYLDPINLFAGEGGVQIPNGFKKQGGNFEQ